VPLYVFHGSDALCRKEALDALKRLLDPDGSLATNTTLLEASTSSPQEVMAACDTVPFLGEHRIVIVEGALSAGGGKRKRKTVKMEEEETGDSGPWGELADYIERMPPSTTLVLVDDAGTVPQWAKVGKVRSFTAPIEWQAHKWVSKRAREKGIKLTPGAAKMLGELIGADTWVLASELDKLDAFTGGTPIGEDHVRVLVSRARQSRGYELSEAVLAGRPAQAMRLVQELLEDGQNWSPLLATITTAYRQAAITKAMTEAGASSSAISSRLKLKPGSRAIDRQLDRARRLSWKAIRSAYARIIAADMDVKRRSMDERLALELCVQDLAVAARTPDGTRAAPRATATARGR
jgi:DNA polymerase-3 subunit delta